MYFNCAPWFRRSTERVDHGFLKSHASRCRRSNAVCGLAAAILIPVILVLSSCGGTSSPSITSVSYPITTPGTGATGSFFGQDTNVVDSAGDPWPGTVVPVTTWRTLGASVKWADIDTGVISGSEDTYDFTRLDRALTFVQQSGMDVIFTMYATPSWASSRGKNCTGVGSPVGCLGPANMDCAFQQQNGPGICDPPIDLSCDGTGSNQIFQNFVTALIHHVGPGKIKYWEMWNEPNISTEWNGGNDCAGSGVAHAGDLMLARMARDMKVIITTVDPEAKFTTPAVSGDAGAWIADYFNNTDGGESADIIAFHGYTSQTGGCPSDCPLAEQIADQTDQIAADLPASQLGKPLFDTEGNWGFVRDENGNLASAITDPDEQASFLARFYLIQMWKQVAKFSWYSWDYPLTQLYDPTTGSLTEAGSAYVQIVRWTNGGTAAVGPCSANGTVWTCTLTATNGAQAEAIWDTSQTCSSGNCTTNDVTVRSQFNAYLDLAGNVTAVANGTAPVGLKPILLIAQ